MNDYVIFTDSACDIPVEKLNEWGVKRCCLTLNFVGSDTQYQDGVLPFHEFYDKMRGGAVSKTAAVNVATFAAAFEEEAAKGNDILYLGFSSGLSTTYNSGRLALAQVKEKYPEGNFIAVDTLAASAGFGLLVYLVAKKKEEGATITEAAAYAEQIKLHICHWFTVDDLVYLKRGGRISGAAAFFGNALGIKPVMHVDNEGHLINVSKVHGRKTAIRTLAEKVGELAYDAAGGTIFVCNGDCQTDVDALEKFLQEKYGRDIDLVVYTGTVVGSHSGPGTLAIFFVGKER